MADSYLERVAGEIADLALADEQASGDINVVDTVAKVLGSSSQTLEEAFLTAVRVRKAEERARNLLRERAANGYATQGAPKPAPMQHTTPQEPDATSDVIAVAPEDAPTETIALGAQKTIEIPPFDDDAPAQITSDVQQDPVTHKNAAEAEQAARDKEVTEDAINRLKKAGIGMPRRINK